MTSMTSMTSMKIDSKMRLKYTLYKKMKEVFNLLHK